MLWWIMAGLLILILLVLLRAIIGPTIIDRLVSINAITSKVSVIILLLAFAREDYGFIDVAFVFMLCGFVGGIWILKVFTPDDWKLKVPGLKGLKGSRDIKELEELKNLEVLEGFAGEGEGFAGEGEEVTAID